MTIHPALADLDGLELELRLTFASTTSAQRAVLAASAEVERAVRALKQGEFGEAQIGEWVSVLLRARLPGRRFEHDTALAALAVVFEDWPSAFADEFLEDLSKVRLVEMSLSTRVAALSLSTRQRTLARTTTKAFPSMAAAHPLPGSAHDPPRLLTAIPESEVARVRAHESVVDWRGNAAA